jgi:tRNA-dihydrouridine synthase B
VTLSQPLQLGRLACKNPFILAPLESVSDAAFRRLCHRLGASLTFTEMIRARGVAQNNKSTLELIDSVHPEVPTGLQLMATGETELAQALQTLERLAATTHPHFANLVAIDLNFGCPSPQIIRIGAGPALLKRRAKLQRMFETLRSFQQKTQLPIAAIGAKIRLGLHRQEQQQKIYLKVVEQAAQTLDYVTIHARHARQDSAESPNLSALAEAKATAKIPLIGNGGLFTADQVNSMSTKTRCDGFLIARGAIQSPWIFRELTSSGHRLPSLDELFDAREAYFDEAKRLQSKPKFLQWHTEGFRRIEQRLKGEKLESTAMPKNENL